MSVFDVFNFGLRGRALCSMWAFRCLSLWRMSRKNSVVVSPRCDLGAMVERVPTVMVTPLGSCDVCPPCFLSLFSVIICMFCTMFNSSPTPPSVMLRMFNIYLSIETQTPQPRAKVWKCEKVLWYLNACLTRWCGGFLRICFCIFIEVEEQGGDLNQRHHRVGGLWESSPRKFLNLVDRKCYFHHLLF